jgi:hypothetical protein
MSDYETVHTINDWYDGARRGIADLNGKPHYFENHWCEDKDDWSEIYLLKPLDAETFALALEDWEIWLRWEQAFKDGKTIQETHPALPEETDRHNQLKRILAARLIIAAETAVRAKAEFIYGQPTKVRWSVVQS